MNVGLIFGIIFAAVIIGFLLFFGFVYLNDMINANCEAMMGDQLIKLREQVGKTFRLSLGATQEFEIIIPSCVEKICFINPEDPSSYGNWETSNAINIMVKSYGYNMIVFGKDQTFDGYKIEHLTAEYNFCIHSKETLLLKNDGSLVMVKPA
jgi:hypothetical protein